MRTDVRSARGTNHDAKGRNNSQQCCELLLQQMLDVVANGAQTDATTLQFRVQAGLASASLVSLSFFFGVGARLFVAVSWWCYFLLNIIKKHFLLTHYNNNVALIIFDVLTRTKIPQVQDAYYDACLCISMETMCNALAWPQHY